MSSKHMLSWMVIAVLIISFTPRLRAADNWSLSPFRAPLLKMQTESGTESDSSSSVLAHSGKKSIGKGVMFSLVIPGTGQLYSGPWWRAVPWFAIEVAGWALFADYHKKGQDKTTEFENYASYGTTPYDGGLGRGYRPNNFDASAYLFAEYRIARDTITAPVVYRGDYSQWINETWTERQRHLPAPFTHDIMTTDPQQYFEMIGKYLLQFGFGWKDTYNWNGDSWSPWTPGETSPDWSHPAQGLRADTSNTVAFDGESRMELMYADMRGKANDYLNSANRAMEVVMVNHIISALDAALAVRSYNKKHTAGPNLGDLKFHYDAKGLNGSIVRSLTVSVPLD
jgi:hypothetical protein